MKVQGHLAGGWLATRWIVNRKKLNKTKRRKYLILGSIAGTLPDWDYIWYAYQKGALVYENDFRHHTWVTHTFPFYWVPAAILYLIGMIRRSDELKTMASIIAASTTVHLLQDTVGSGDGIMMLYPASKKMQGIALSGLHGDEWEAHYTKSPIYAIELGICLLAIATFIYDLVKKRL